MAQGQSESAHTVSAHTVSALTHLYRIVEAGEKGFAVAAASVRNRALKILFKTYAQQRAKFKSEIHSHIQDLDGDFALRSSIRGLIHRGRIAIVAALTIGAGDREEVVLKEVVLGERTAVRTYENTLEKELPSQTREMVERQFEQVRRANEQVNLMKGKEGKRLVVKLVNTEEDAETATRALTEAGFPREAIDRIDLVEASELYQGRGTTVLETTISGAVGGALWGGLFGAVAGIGVVQMPDLELIGTTTTAGTWALVALSGILVGAFIGAALGLFIGVGISEEDTFLYDQSIQQGQTLVKAVVDEARAADAKEIMAQLDGGSITQAGKASI